MTVSLPTKPVYVIDLPEITDLSTKFVYNYYVNDESINETGGIPVDQLTRQSIEANASFVQYATTRVPRYVQISFSPRQNVTVQPRSTFQNGSLISRNIDKIIAEDAFSYDGFIAMSFYDGGLRTKVAALVSGSVVQHIAANRLTTDGSVNALAKKLL
jgi:hypothetical protein